MTVTPTVRRTTVLVAAALALTGCGSPGDDPGGTATTSSSSAAEYVPGPLDEYLARIYGYSFDAAEQQTLEEADAEYSRQSRQLEELIATCMREEGFDYTPADPGGTTVVSGDDLDVQWGTVEFAEQYGYGISTDPWGMASQVEGDAGAWVDPNQDYLDAMSDSEREAYQQALYGAATDDVVQSEDDAGEYAEYDWTTAGCTGAAQREVYDDPAVSEAGDYSALEDAIEDRWEQVGTGAAMAALEADWAACMADEGFAGMSAVSAATEDLYLEWSSLNGWDEVEAVDLTEMAEVDPVDLAAFTEQEIRQAVADHGCQEEIDYQARYTAIDHADQQAFVDLHRDELEAWAEAATAARGE
ncbi:MAG TPA: hypothetical protein VGC57_04970 [Cellulomonas sp.]